MIFVQIIISLFVFLSIEYIYPTSFVFCIEKFFFLSQVTIIWTFLFVKFRLGVIYRTQGILSLIRGYLVTISIAGILLFVELRILILLGHYSFSVYYILLFCIIDLVVLVIFKLAFYAFMHYYRGSGHNTRNIIIIADGTANKFIANFQAAKDWGYKIVSIITPDEGLSDLGILTYHITDYKDLFKKIILKGIDDLFYCLPINDKRYDIANLIKQAEQIGVSVHIIQEGFYKNLQNDNFIGKMYNNSFITYQTTPRKYISLKIKEVFDIILSAFALVLTAPIMALISILIYLEDGGSVFFKQERIGLNGRRFICFKFRSMVPNAEKLIDDLKHRNESDGPTFKIENDPRITKIGRFLRKTSLDEFPQFFNVIKGEMSIVGPRPPLLKEVKQYEKYQLRRLSMKPGITCIWQVEGRNTVTFTEWMRMDLEYIDRWSIWSDIKIIFQTALVVFRASGR